jgi:PAS domain S-box-containing protein
VARLALSLARSGGDGLIQARTADLAYGMVLCWQDDPRQVVEPLRENSRLAIRHGTYEYGGYSLLKSLAYQLFTSCRVDELAAEIESGLLTMKMLGQTRMVCYLQRDAAVLRRIQEPGDRPESLDDKAFCLQALLDDLEASHDQYGLLYTAVSCLLLAVVFERPEAAERLAAQAESYGVGGPGLLHQGMLSWLGALAYLLPESPLDQDRLARAEASLGRLQSLAPQGGLWHPRCALIRAELARHRGQQTEAAEAYNEAYSAAQTWELPLDQYLICRRRALFQPERAAYWRAQAEGALREWRGEKAEPFALPCPAHLEAAAAVATSTTVEALGSALMNFLRTTVGATRGVVAGPSGRVLASWNAPENFGAAEVEALLSGQSLCARSDRLGQGLWAGEVVSGAILLHDERGFSAAALSLLDSAARLAGGALLGMGARRAEAEWGERETLYATLTQECPAGLFARDREGRLIWANQAYAKALHASLHTLLGRRLTDALPSLLAEQQQAECQSVIDEEREVESLVLIPGPDGEVREYMVHRVPLWDRHGRVMGMCGVTTDLTDLRRAQEQLERHRRLQALGHFASGIAHDVNNMVTVVGCNLDLLELTVGDDPRWTDSLHNIRMASRRAQDLAERILLFGQPKPQGCRLDLPAMLEESARLCRSALPPGAALEVEVRPYRGAVYGDPVQMGQVISNLVTNAAQALQSGQGDGLIRLRLEDSPPPPPSGLPEGPSICLVIEDNGSGMSSETLLSAFDPYFTTKPRGEGTGLGLSIVHGIVSSMGGNISVASRPGEGTTFRLYFPISEELPASSPARLGSASDGESIARL